MAVPCQARQVVVVVRVLDGPLDQGLAVDRDLAVDGLSLFGHVPVDAVHRLAEVIIDPINKAIIDSV